MAKKVQSSGKQYKNVYTILEKVKKGEIRKAGNGNNKKKKDYYYDDYDDGLFGRINFWKRPDLIQPHMHWLDERRLENILDSFMGDAKMIEKNYMKFAKSTDAGKIPPDKKFDAAEFQKKFTETYKKFPKHLQKDMFKLYYHTMPQLEFEKRDEKNHAQFRFLEKANNPVGKIMTEHSNVKSAIFTRNIMAYFISRMVALEYTDAEASKQLQKGLNGEGDGKGTDEAMQKMIDSLNGQKAMDEAIKEAMDTCKELDKNMDHETQEQLYNSADSPGEAGKLSPEHLKMVAAQLQSIKLSMGSLKNHIKKLMDKTTSYFSAKKITTYEDLFNTDNTGGIEDFELLHPKLRKIFMEDVMIKDTKSIGKVNIMIDISTSMNDRVGVTNINGQAINKIEFCKAFAAKLLDLDVLNKVYLFNNHVRTWKNDLISISMIGTSGGTSINEAVRHIEKERINTIVITDAEDGCNIYSEYAYFIGIKGARFSGFNPHTIRQYSERDQVIVFDGEVIQRVDTNGVAHKH